MHQNFQILCTLLCVYCTMIYLLTYSWYDVCVCVWHVIKFCIHSPLFGFFPHEEFFAHSQDFYSPWGFPLVCVGPPQTLNYKNTNYYNKIMHSYFQKELIIE